MKRLTLLQARALLLTIKANSKVQYEPEVVLPTPESSAVVCQMAPVGKLQPDTSCLFFLSHNVANRVTVTCCQAARYRNVTKAPPPLSLVTAAEHVATSRANPPAPLQTLHFWQEQWRALVNTTVSFPTIIAPTLEYSTVKVSQPI